MVYEGKWRDLITWIGLRMMAECEDERNCTKSLLYDLNGINALQVVKSYLVPWHDTSYGYMLKY
jgi:hypothetical protein